MNNNGSKCGGDVERKEGRKEGIQLGRKRSMKEQSQTVRQEIRFQQKVNSYRA